MAEIEKCDHMTALRLEGNTLGVEAAEAVAKALGKHPEFEVRAMFIMFYVYFFWSSQLGDWGLLSLCWF